MTAKTQNPDPHRNIALCYVRQSWTRNPTDMDSPERQRANIEEACRKNGWTAEWYQDAEKHKTGTKEHNRPGWMALKARLGDPDIVALVANDLSRLHRKGWRVGDLIDYLDQRGVTLVLAAPGREIDLSTPMGRLFVQFTAILDEWYAADISQRAKDVIAHRKAKGLTVGMPPFGTVRGKDGYLRPTTRGAWLLPDGTFAPGKRKEAPPVEGALFKGYYDCVKEILTLYATGEFGLEKIAYEMNNQGWAFRDRSGNPRPLTSDDIRRVVANWPEYGGVSLYQKATGRRAYEDINLAELPFREDRAVFPIQLVKEVADVRKARTNKRVADHSTNLLAYPYPLGGITYCYHCEQLAVKHDNGSLRTKITGKGGAITYEKLRYRHKSGVSCGVTNRSVPAEEFERDFVRLINLLSITPEAMSLMTELAIQADRARRKEAGEEDIEAQKQEALNLCYRRIDAAIHLYREGTIERDEYQRIREQNEREIAHWQSRTSETEKMALELAMCVEAVDKLAKLWETSSDEDRQGLARSLFEEIIYDLDRRQIVSFRLKSWADRFIVLRAALYDHEDKQKETAERSLGMGNPVLHTGCFAVPCLSFAYTQSPLARFAAA